MHRPRIKRTRYRDRHGRGLRGPLAPAELPVARTRAQAFQDLVEEAVERLKPQWSRELSSIDFVVEDVPIVPPAATADDGIPFARSEVSRQAGRARIVIYRRPVEIRTSDPEEKAELVYDTVVEEVASILGLEPETLDPEA